LGNHCCNIEMNYFPQSCYRKVHPYSFRTADVGTLWFPFFQGLKLSQDKMQLDSIKLLSIRWKTPNQLGVFFWQPQQPGWLICMVDPLNQAHVVADMTRKKWFIWVKKWSELERAGIKLRSSKIPCCVLAAKRFRQPLFLFSWGHWVVGEDNKQQAESGSRESTCPMWMQTTTCKLVS
jgi:hypothetical protein